LTGFFRRPRHYASYDGHDIFAAMLFGHGSMFASAPGKGCPAPCLFSATPFHIFIFADTPLIIFALSRRYAFSG
jgi:hypothetical protein